MNEVKQADVWGDTGPFQREVCAVLGLTFFESARFEMELGLLLASVDPNGDHSARVMEVEGVRGIGFRLQRLRDLVEQNLVFAEVSREEFDEWVARANRLREIRNDYTHGRWHVSEETHVISNVVGIPGSPVQAEKKYSLVDIKTALNDFRSLRDDFCRFRIIRNN